MKQPPEDSKDENNTSITITPKLLAILIIAVIGFSIYVAFAINILDTARAAPDQTYSSCTITNKTVSQVKSSTVYFVESTCGNFTADSQLWESLTVPNEYDLTAGQDNWPQLPNLTKATLSP